MNKKIQVFLDSTNQKIKRILSSVVTYISKVSIPVVVVSVLGAIVLLIAKYRDLIMDILTGESKAEVNSADKKDAELKTQEDKDNFDANALVQKANNETNVCDQPDDDWYLKK